MTAAVAFYDVVVWFHVSAIIIAFGVTFAYPIIVPWFLNQRPRAAPDWFAVMTRIGRYIITPFATIALLTGAYLATDRELWGEVWVNVPLLILIVLLGLAGAFFTPNERRLEELTRRDVDAAGGGQVTWSEEVQALSRRVGAIGSLGSLLVLLAAYFMVTKPFA